MAAIMSRPQSANSTSPDTTRALDMEYRNAWPCSPFSVLNRRLLDRFKFVRATFNAKSKLRITDQGLL